MLTLCCVRQAPILNMAQMAAQQQSNTILIVPEQLSHEAERTLSSVGGAAICLRAEVLSFTRLAQRVASIHGGAARKSLDGAGRILAMSLAVEELRSKIKYFAAALTRTEFLKELVQAVDELKSCCVEPAQLLQYARQQSGRSAQKFEELGLIMESYAAVCANTAYDPRDALTHLAERLSEVDYADGRRFFLGGFQDFTPQQLRVIEALLRRGADVTVLLCDDLSEQTSTCFAASRQTARQLRAIAARCGAEIETRRVLPDFFPEQAHLLEHLYDGALWPWEGSSEQLQIYSALSSHQECRMAAERIYTLVQQGARYRDFGVVLCGEAGHLQQLQPIFHRLQIPYYCAGRTQIQLRPLPMLVLAALEAVAFEYRRESVIDYLRSGLTNLTEDETDRLENYAIAWNIRSSKWLRVWIDHPEGYDGQMDEAARGQLDELNALRRRAIEPLQQLDQDLRQARTLQQQTLALFACIRKVGVSEQLEQMVRALEDADQQQAAAEETQMYSIFVGALEQLYTLGGTAARTPEGFYRLVKLLLEQYEVSSIPAGVDCVTIGSLEDLRGRPYKHLLILGSVDGAFPSYTPMQSLITEEERELLLQGGIELPLLQQRLDRQILSIYNVLSGAKESLYLSSTEGEEEPSYLFLRIRRQFPNAAVTEPDSYLSDYDSVRSSAALALSSGASFPDVLPQPLRSALEEASRDLRKRAAYSPGNLDEAALRALYGGTLHLSPSRIDRLASCRCGYYLEYGLRLSERREFRFDAPVFGTFVHYVLEHTVRRAEELGGFRQISDQQLQELADQNIRHFTEEYMNGLAGKDERFTYLYHRNRAEVISILMSLAREMRLSSFRPTAFELRFAPDGDLPAVQIPDAVVPAQIVGVVDRADVLKTPEASYLRIVDYKTGRKSLDYTDLSIGVGLQMLIYLFSMQKTGLPGDDANLQPAGVLYFPAREPFLSANHRPDDHELSDLRKKQNRRNGLISDDEMLLAAMEETQGDPEFLPYKNAKSGRKGDLATREQWRLLEAHVQKSLKELVAQVSGGDVTPNPYQRGTYSSCVWCAYASVCRHASSGGCMRNYEKITASEFWSQLEKEGEDHA